MTTRPTWTERHPGESAANWQARQSQHADDPVSAQAAPDYRCPDCGTYVAHHIVAAIEQAAVRVALAAAREELAALEHEQWAAWAMTLLATESISAERRARWQPLINAGYEELSEEEKDHDRKWADRVIAAVLAETEGPGGT